MFEKEASGSIACAVACTEKEEMNVIYGCDASKSLCDHGLV